MTRARNAALILLCLLLAAPVFAQGRGRINGKIFDDTGKPTKGAQVRATPATGAPLQAVTNEKGEWKLENMAAGQWTLEFYQQGMEPQRMTVAIEAKNNPPIDTKLTKAIDPNVELQAKMKEAADLQTAGKQADARKIVADLLAKYPEAVRLNAFIATTYEAEKNYDKAIEHVKLVVEKEPNELEFKMFLAELYSTKGDMAESQKILDSVDMTQVKDPTIFLNMAIGAINAQKGDEAVAMLDRVAKAFPTRSDIIYYRARANIAAKKMPEAKADLEKFVSMAPADSPQMADAKKLLEQLKAVK